MVYAEFMTKKVTADTILDSALKLAEEKSWEALRLHDIASELNISLDQIRLHYSQKDDLVEAWYDQADSAMLNISENPGFNELTMQQRLHTLIMAWLDKLAEHKQVSRDMLMYKLEPGHIHLQVLGILRVSRTVQWIREAAHQDDTHLFRILEEIGLTSVYLLTFSHWLFDQTDKQQATRDFLQKKLHRAGQCIHSIPGFTQNQPSSSPN